MRRGRQAAARAGELMPGSQHLEAGTVALFMEVTGTRTQRVASLYVSATMCRASMTRLGSWEAPSAALHDPAWSGACFLPSCVRSLRLGMGFGTPSYASWLRARADMQKKVPGAQLGERDPQLPP